MIVDIINKKRLGQELSYRELDFIFNGYLEGKVADYQMSSLLMAICINGMTDEEVFSLTKIFVDSGDILDFDELGILVDKHSTGGIGDKVTLIIAPIVAACGCPMMKMSGRGLGYTGGTIDKLESIPGFRTNLTDEEIYEQIKKIGVVITGQTKDLAPMDKAIYALRDVTATVSSIPLIASSIMSKKIASGADKILIDVKVGKGALINNEEDAQKLCELMVKIGKIYHKEVRTKISNMNIPLGYAIGNSVEVLEAIDILKGKERDNYLVDLCLDISSELVSMGKNISKDEALHLVKDALEKGYAYQKFLEIVKMQGGDLEKIQVSKKEKYIIADKTGILSNIDALELGKLAISLGAGRIQKDDKIDSSVGIRLHYLVGEKVRKGDVLATIYVKSKVKLSKCKDIFDIQKKTLSK